MDPQRIAAIEVGGSKCLAAIGHRATFRESYLRIPTGDPEDTIGQLLACLRQGYAEQPFAAIGVASFGPLGINPETPDYGIIGTTPKPLWQGLDYLDALAEFGVPIAVDSDVNAAGLAEFVGQKEAEVSTDQLVRLADDAMYRVKHRGGNGIELV